MTSVNKTILIGRVGKDPEVRYAASGAAIVNISLATSRKWKDKASGQMQEETEWHRVAAFDKLAEIIGEYVRKGSLIYIEGRLKTRKWTDKDGRDVYTTEVMADQMQMLGGRDQTAQDGGQGSAPAARQSAPAPKPQAAAKPSGTAFDDMDDDIPF